MNIKFQKNIGSYDRLVRLCFGIILLMAAYWFMSWLLFVAALILSVYAFSYVGQSSRVSLLAKPDEAVGEDWCLWYQIIGKNSCPVDLKKR